MKENIIFYLSFFLILVSCADQNKRADQSETAKKSFDESEMIKSIYEKIIKPEEAKFYLDAQNLKSLTVKFVGDVNSENLKAVRSQWLEVAKDWARCFAFNIGNVKRGLFFRYLATFPVKVDGLESSISSLSLDEITADYVLNLGLDVKGLYGIEYLLYKDSFDATLSLYKNDEKRRKFLFLEVNELVSDISDNKAQWDEYASIFLANRAGKDSNRNSFNQIFAGIDNVIHYMWETKLGKAIRKDDIEARFSKRSLELIRENIEITKRVYFDGGLADKLRFAMNGFDGVNQDITKRYDRIEKALNAIDEPLLTAVKNSKKKLVKALIKELKDLEQIEFAKVETVLNLIDGTKEGDGD